ncbi:MAG: LOG family protein [Nitrospinaceae bacterium]|jgi:uncharacterized protein (TIGR00730 family)
MKSICVFCASSNAVDKVYHQVATDLGQRIGLLGLDLIFGGGGIGLMGDVARGVHDKGGRVVGVIPEFFLNNEQPIEYAKADELIVTKDMRSRKAIMDERSDAFIVLPGGIGTLEEATEIISMKQLGLTEKPIVFINTNKFYDAFILNLNRMVELKFAKQSTLDLINVLPDPLSALEFMTAYQPQKTNSKWL